MPSVPTAFLPSISSWHCRSRSLLMKWYTDVNTISGFSFDSCDILSNSVSIVLNLSLCIDYVSSSIWLCTGGLRGTARSRLPSIGITRLHRYYSPVRLPAIHLSFSFRCLIYPHSALNKGNHGFSPVDAVSLYSMAGLRPRDAGHLLARVRLCPYCLPCSKACRHTRRLISGLKRLLTLLPDFLRLTLHVTMASPRFAIGGVASPYRVGFPPIKHCTLSWAHLPFTT